ncbi:hypothetical protein [Nocardia sp. NPDC058633]|uniref:hypothetical protein n=1 Tax=Nocardia sp. NPDC058633 TaxID=3346568 RepID=UPI00365C9CF0
MSVDYIVRLEQGRGPKQLNQALGALTRALRLNDVDRDFVYRLAAAEPPQAGRISMLIRPIVMRLFDRLADLPVMVLFAKFDILAWKLCPRPCSATPPRPPSPRLSTRSG